MSRPTIGDLSPLMLLWLIFLVCTFTMLFWKGFGNLLSLIFVGHL